ncbi:MAG: type I-F CRISPR-associated endonuclease Cas1f [Gammaproteobacteria bacterium]|nr:type I-F CRISPR-associated endonuclease Cas1f [Gammaproteobacteria bacterium]MDH5731863.1 type I-F CRISPR-associated endonuclease Cas1f [Gammaproteobacteria bacterium]
MSILPSHRQGLYYLEHCRIMTKDERIVYARKDAAFTKFFSIPPANTNIVLLGNGTSLTQSAARMLSDEGVLIGFTGGGGTPLYLASQSEYRPTAYLQSWMKFWFDAEKRISVAKQFQLSRCQFLLKAWAQYGLPDEVMAQAENVCQQFAEQASQATSIESLMGQEANFAKRIYRCISLHLNHSNFQRIPGKKETTDLFNSYLDHGNYLAYGLAATVLWVYGIPHSLPVSHGMTRRGALVFDVADMIKDGAILPVAFEAAASQRSDSEMRKACVANLDRTKALRFMFNNLKKICEREI